MQQFKFFWISVFLFSFISPSFADYKNEIMKIPPRCLFQCILNDGFYIGVAAGYDIYQIQTKSQGNSEFFDGTFSFSSNPELNAEGIVGGAYFGYGKYFPYLYNTYLGIEAFGNGSAAASSYLLNSTDASYEIDVKGKNNFGLSLVPGIKLVSSTLFYLKLGYLGSKIDVDEIFKIEGEVLTDVEKTPIVYGWLVGAGIENAFFDDFSLRAEYVYQFYNSFVTDVGAKINPSNGEFMLGLTYRIIL